MFLHFLAECNLSRPKGVHQNTEEEEQNLAKRGLWNPALELFLRVSPEGGRSGNLNRGQIQHGSFSAYLIYEKGEESFLRGFDGTWHIPSPCLGAFKDGF